MNHDEQLWAAVSEPRRLEIIDILLSGEANITSLARQLPVTRQAASKHLAFLEEVGLVASRRSGREMLYHVDPGRLEEVRQAMARRANLWDRRLAMIKAVAEERAGKLDTGGSPGDM